MTIKHREATPKPQAVPPMAGVKVVEFCNVVAGPFCSMLLAEAGAEVVKVESPAGDTLRQWPSITTGMSGNFCVAPTEGLHHSRIRALLAKRPGLTRIL